MHSSVQYNTNNKIYKFPFGSIPTFYEHRCADVDIQEVNTVLYVSYECIPGHLTITVKGVIFSAHAH